MMIGSIATPTPGLTGVWVFTLAVIMASMVCVAGGAREMKVPVKFSGGHETDPRDGGRPVVLVAAALGVEPEVFREAFSGVTPARGGPPSPQEARCNKAALMKVLRPHGVTNERLDQVSDYYRYRPQRGELWPTTPAEAHAVVENGKVKQVVVTSPGSGTARPPKRRCKACRDSAQGDAPIRQGPQKERGDRFGRDRITASASDLSISPVRRDEWGGYHSCAFRVLRLFRVRARILMSRNRRKKPMTALISENFETVAPSEADALLARESSRRLATHKLGRRSSVRIQLLDDGEEAETVAGASVRTAIVPASADRNVPGQRGDPHSHPCRD